MAPYQFYLVLLAQTYLNHDTCFHFLNQIPSRKRRDKFPFLKTAGQVFCLRVLIVSPNRDHVARNHFCFLVVYMIIFLFYSVDMILDSDFKLKVIMGTGQMEQFVKSRGDFL